MDNQEMQFADPAWRPPHERESNETVPNQPLYVPQPINKSSDNQMQWEAASTQQPYMDTPYAGYEDYQVSPLQSNPPPYVRSQQRKHRNPFIWLIAAFIIITVMGSGLRPTFTSLRMSHDIPPYHMHDEPYNQPQQIPVGDHPTIVINNPYGSVHIYTGGPADQVTVQTNQEERGDVPPLISQSDNGTLTISVDSSGDAAQVDLNVIVANEANLTVQTNDGDIEVDNVSGQLSLTSDSGTITASQVTLEGTSTLRNNSGSISFDGAIAPNSTSHFQTSSGSIDVTLPPDASFHADVTTNSDSFNSDFPEMRIQAPDVHQTHGNVGNDPHTTVTIITDSGSIDLRKGS
jgi:hypothetical protein